MAHSVHSIVMAFHPVISLVKRPTNLFHVFSGRIELRLVSYLIIKVGAADGNVIFLY